MRQRGASWELRVFLGMDPTTGKRQYASKTVKGSKRDAQRELSEMVTQANQGRIAAAGATVGQLLEEWFAKASPDFSPKTVKETRGLLDRHLLPALAPMALRRLKTRDLDVFYGRLRAGRATSRKPLAPATIRRIHGVLHVALEQGVRWGWLTINPASAATPPRVIPHEIKPPSSADLGRLFVAAQSVAPALATFVAVAAATGARRSEVLALRWRNVDLDGGRLEIARGIVAGPNGLVEKDTKTHAARRVSLDPTTVDLLRAHHRAMAERAETCGASLKATAFVFSDAADQTDPWRPDSTTRKFINLRDSCGLSGVRLHDLRHYVATTMLTNGVDVRTVAGRLGHRNAATTLNVYSHFVEGADRDAAGKLGAIFDAAVAADSTPERPAKAVRAPRRHAGSQRHTHR